MDRKFIKNHCRKCLRSLDVFGLWCAENMTKDRKGLIMCTELQECPYKQKHPSFFDKGYHLRPSAKKEMFYDSIDDE